MLSKAKIREILGNQKLTEEQTEVIRNEMCALAEIFFEEISPSSGSKEHGWVIDSERKSSKY